MVWKARWSTLAMFTETSTTIFVESRLYDQDFYFIAESSTWTFLNCTYEG